jgi:hypothetical protein
VSFYETARDLLLLIEVADFDPGQIDFVKRTEAVEICTWYSTLPEREAADRVVALLFGIDFNYSIRESIGFADFTGTWGGLNIKVIASDRAGYCTRVPVGSKVVPATEEHEEIVYAYQCKDPITEAVAS